MTPDAAIRVTAKRLGGLFGIVDVAHHDGRAGNADLTFDVGLHFLLRARGDDLIVGIRKRNANGA